MECCGGCFFFVHLANLQLPFLESPVLLSSTLVDLWYTNLVKLKLISHNYLPYLAQNQSWPKRKFAQYLEGETEAAGITIWRLSWSEVMREVPESSSFPLLFIFAAHSYSRFMSGSFSLLVALLTNSNTDLLPDNLAVNALTCSPKLVIKRVN